MKTFVIAVLMTVSSLAHADKLTEMTGAVCEKIKTCGVAQLEQQGLPAETVQMMKAMFDGMCTSMVSPYINRTLDAGLEKKAVACLDSIQSMSCPDLMQGGADNSAECKEFEKAADEAGLIEEK